MLGLAGYNEPLLAELTRKSIEKKLELLEAKETKFFAFEGEVVDERTVADNRVQLEASKALDDILGVKAPPAKQTITVVHKVELPAWMMPDDQPPTTIEVSSTVES